MSPDVVFILGAMRTWYLTPKHQISWTFAEKIWGCKTCMEKQIHPLYYTIMLGTQYKEVHKIYLYKT
jgi:hypothetical protein